MNMETQAAAAEFKALFASADKDQWRLAELAFLGTEGDMTVKAFAEAAGITTRTVNRYRTTWLYRENETHGSDLVFTDASVLANSSDEQAAALQIVAGANEIGIKTAANTRVDQVKAVREYVQANPEVMAEAMKGDEATYDVVIGAALESQRDNIVAAATGITKAAATPIKRVRPGMIRVTEARVELAKLIYTDTGRIGYVQRLLADVWDKELSDDDGTDRAEIIDALYEYAKRVNGLYETVGLELKVVDQTVDA